MVFESGWPSASWKTKGPLRGRAESQAEKDLGTGTMRRAWRVLVPRTRILSGTGRPWER
jgi:hypothetical protein